MYVLIITWMFSLPNGHRDVQQNMTRGLDTEKQCLILAEERKKSLVKMDVLYVETKCIKPER